MTVNVSIEIEAQPMVTITRHHSEDHSIFPPINHEGLHTSSHPHSTTNTPKYPSDSSFSLSHLHPSSSSLSSSTSISIDIDDSECFAYSFKESPLTTKLHQDCINQLQERDARAQVSPYGWLLFGIEIMRRKIQNYTCVIPGCGAIVAAFRSFPLMTTLMAVYVGSLLLKWIQMRRSPQRRINVLMSVIRQKDEKIVKLLDQIAQLNQVLLERRRSQ